MFFFSQIQMTMPLKLSFSDKLNKLEKQYERLLVRDLSSLIFRIYEWLSNKYYNCLRACFCLTRPSLSELIQGAAKPPGEPA